MTDPFKVPAWLQHLIEKRETERRNKNDRRGLNSSNPLPKAAERRDGQERREPGVDRRADEK